MAGRVQFKSGNGQGVTSVALSFTSLPTVGNTILAVVADFNDNHVTGASVTDNQGHTYTRDLAYSGTGNGPGSVMVFRTVVATSSGTFTVTFNNGGNWFTVNTIIEVNGIATTSPVDQQFSNDLPDSGSNYTSTSVTTTQADEYLLGINHPRNTTTALTPTSPWSTISTNSDGSFQILHTQDQVVSSTGSYADAGTFTGGGLSTASIITYKLAAATTVPNLTPPIYPDLIAPRPALGAASQAAWAGFLDPTLVTVGWTPTYPDQVRRPILPPGAHPAWVGRLDPPEVIFGWAPVAPVWLPGPDPRARQATSVGKVDPPAPPPVVPALSWQGVWPDLLLRTVTPVYGLVMLTTPVLPPPQPTAIFLNDTYAGVPTLWSSPGGFEIGGTW